MNKWNGFGGKVEQGESIEEACQRELFEECGITVSELQKHAVITFKTSSQEKLSEVVGHIFIGKTEGIVEAEETEEMLPQWFTLDTIPYSNMWANDRLWIPEILKGKFFKATFQDADMIDSQEYSIIECTPEELHQ